MEYMRSTYLPPSKMAIKEYGQSTKDSKTIKSKKNEKKMCAERQAKRTKHLRIVEAAPIVRLFFSSIHELHIRVMSVEYRQQAQQREHMCYDTPLTSVFFLAFCYSVLLYTFVVRCSYQCSFPVCLYVMLFQILII